MEIQGVGLRVYGKTGSKYFRLHRKAKLGLLLITLEQIFSATRIVSLLVYGT